MPARLVCSGGSQVVMGQARTVAAEKSGCPQIQKVFLKASLLYFHVAPNHAVVIIERDQMSVERRIISS